MMPQKSNLTSRGFWIWLAGILSVGFALRYFLAFFPLQVFADLGVNNYGFNWDMSTFADWMFTIKSAGFQAYVADPSINYPPVFAEILSGLNTLGDWFGGGDPTQAQKISISLLKLPAILADLGVAFVVARAGKKWFSSQVGLWASGLYLFIPAVWYDSAVWGQVDSISALFMLLAVVCIADRKPEWSAIFVVMAILTKPQGILVGLVIAPIFVGMLLHRHLNLWRIASTFGAALFSFIALAVPWNLRSYNTDGLSNLPVIGDAVGLWIQFKSTAGLFPVLTANAYNVWALAGDGPLAQQFQHNMAAWQVDNIQIVGVPANVFGNALFLIVVAFVFWFLVRRPTVQNALLGFAVVLVAFYDLPTRVHERYLIQAFAILCLVWATRWRDRIALVVLASANVLNLHAILSNGLNVIFPPAPPSDDLVFQHHGQAPESYGIFGTPFSAGFTRDAWLVYLVVAIQLLALVYLIWQIIDTNRKQEKVVA